MVINSGSAVAWPQDFVARMEAWLGDEAQAFLAALAKRDQGLRLNPLRGPLEALRAQLPWEVEPVPWCPEGLWLQEDAAIGTHPYHTAGVYYGQDPSAMAAAVLLDPQPGEWVLDLAAAPGGKATHIGARMSGQGVLVANEISRSRATVLAMNLERMGVTNALVTNAGADQLAQAWRGLFDAMLIDAPCSGEGMFSRDRRALKEWSLAAVAEYAWRQQNILEQGAPLVRPGGRILYGTCTYAPEENEGVIAKFLDTHPDFALLDLPDLPHLERGHPEWIGAPPDLVRTGRFWPHKSPGHGHFYALLRRTGDPPDDLPEQWAGRDIPGRVLRLYEKTLGEALTFEPPEAGLVLTGDDHCYITPMAPPLWSRVPVLRPGWWVATQRHGKIYPDHALAMALRIEDVACHIRLAPDDPHVSRYLDGSAWLSPGEPGFVLTTVDGFPLGWSKREGDRLRSRYPVNLRRQRASS